MAIYLVRGDNGQEVVLGPFLDDTDGKTAETGLTIANTDIKLWKAGATSLVNKNSGGATHMANGLYVITLDAVDTSNYGPLVIFVHVAGALPVRVECDVVKLDWRRYSELSTLERMYWNNCVYFQAGGTPTATTIPIDLVEHSDFPVKNNNDAYIGMMLVSYFDYQTVSRVVDYNGTTKVLTIDPPLPVVPSSGDTFMLIPGSPGSLADNAITAAKIASDAVTEIQSGLATSSGLATIQSYVDELESRLTATRAGYLDNLSGGALATAAALTTLTGLVDDLEGRLTAARAGYLDNLNTGAPLSAAAVDAILDEVVEGSLTLRQAIRLFLAVMTGESSGGGTTSVTFRDIADSKNRLVFTVDANGNRTAVGTRDGT